MGGPVPPLLYEGAMWYNLLFGGKADKNKPGDFDPKELKRGRGVEREHTRDLHLQTEIAMDHLREDPEYYKKLQYVEKKTLPFIQKMLREYDDRQKKLVKRASLRDLAGNYPLVGVLSGAALGTGVGLATSPKEERLKRTFRSALYGAAAGIGAAERMTPSLETTYKRLLGQRSIFGRIKARKLRQGDIQEHWDRLAREDRPKRIAAGTVGASAGLGLTDLGLNAMNKVREAPAPLEAKKKKKRQLVYVR